MAALRVPPRGELDVGLSKITGLGGFLLLWSFLVWLLFLLLSLFIKLVYSFDLLVFDLLCLCGRKFSPSTL